MTLNSVFSRNPLPSLFKATGLALAFASSALFLGHTAFARSRDMVLLQHNQSSVEVPLSDLQALAETGELSDELEEYFSTIPVSPEETQIILSEVIFDGGIPISSNSVEFLTIQLSRSIGDTLRRERRDDMFDALSEAFADDRQISIMEIVENYPDSTTRVSLNRLARLQTDLTLFVERIEPVLAVVEELLPELVCDCLLEGETVPVTELFTDTQLLATTTLLNSGVKSGNPNDKVCDGVTLADKRAEYNRAIAQLKSISTTLTASSSSVSSAKSNLTSPVESVNNPLPNQSQILLAQSEPQPLIPLNTTTRSRVPASIVEDIIIAFGPLRPSFSVAAMEEFIETGVVPNGWRFYFSVAGINAEEFRTALTKEVAVDVAFVGGLLNNTLGEYLLFQVGTIIRTPSRDSNIQALRAAIILSSVDDGKISLFEFIKNYPASQVVVEGVNLARFGSNLSRQGVVGTATSGLEDMLLELQADVADDVCNCADEEESDAQNRM